MRELSEEMAAQVSGAGFGDYGGYTDGGLGASAGCAIDSILGIPACGHMNGSSEGLHGLRPVRVVPPITSGNHH